MSVQFVNFAENLKNMRILHLSDTHGAHHRLRELPPADILVHSGDFCMVGEDREALDFLNWFCDLPYKHKMFICGNHDSSLYGNDIEGLDPNVHYLCNSGIEIEGLKFYGVPMFYEDCAYGRQTGYYANIPDDTDILITHSPAYGILDLDSSIDDKYIHYGSKEIRDRLIKIHPRAHLFGHVHRCHGVTEQNGIVFSNGAIMNDDYTKLHQPHIIEI